MLKLRVAHHEVPHLLPLLDGTVRPEGIDLDFELGQPGSLFHRHMDTNEFDVFEFSISDFLIIRDRPQMAHLDWTGIPIFYSRAFLGLNTVVNVNAGIESFADLGGKCFGIPDFTMTAGLWLRAMLDSLYGIRAQDIGWYVGRSRETSHGVQMGLDEDPPPGLQLTWLENFSVLNRMLHAGQIQAAYGATEDPIEPGPAIRPLLRDGGREFVGSFFRKTGFTPVNHVLVMQRRIAESEPWVPMALYEAFERSKQEAYRRNPPSAALFTGDDLDAQLSFYGSDPYPSGLSANRSMLKMAARQSLAEGLTRKLADVDGLFWESVRGT
ncbi:MAG: 4,5-dihydroxyphthalate decarboxylase [Chloroflexi bacterium]|nr:4,5-dihydroxyphthalate decarboxylase [Chloroflexota bacterium]